MSEKIPANFESQRAHSPWLAAGLASIKNKIPIGDRRFLAAGCEELQSFSLPEEWKDALLVLISRDN